MIHQPSRRGHYDLGLFLQLVHLLVNGLTAVQADHPNPLFQGRQLPQVIADLQGQLPGRRQDERCHIGAFRVGVLYNGDAKSIGLAGAGGCLGYYVLIVHQKGDTPALNGGCHLISFVL